MADPRSTDTPRPGSRRVTLVVVVALVAALAAVGAAALLINIFERETEARNPFSRVVELTDDTVDPEVWGKNFPLQWDGYRRTVDQVQSRLDEDPRLKTMWAGYAFARDVREERGHAHMLTDQSGRSQ